MASLVQSFATTAQLSIFPPAIQEIELHFNSFLPPQDTLIHWAIVRADPGTKQVWLEGSIERSEKPSPAQ